MLLLCLVAALLPTAGTRPESGEEEPRLGCTAHLLTTGSSLSCKLVGGWSREGDEEEEDEGDAVVHMAVCFYDFHHDEATCLEAPGDTVTHLNPLLPLNVSALLRTGGRLSTTVDLKTIVRPRSPQVNNVTMDQEARRAVIRFQTPYANDYITVDNQLFQLHIWTAGSSMTQNVSADSSLEIGLELLRPRARYQVRVRAIPERGLQGSWSEWSDRFSFFTPADLHQQTDERRETNRLIVCLLILLAVPSSVVFLCKNKVFTSMWPSVPQPEHTLLHLWRSNRSLLLNFKPVEFSALKVEKTTQSTPPCSTQSTPPYSTQSSPPCSTQSTPPYSTQSSPPCSTQSSPPYSTQSTPPYSTQSTPPYSTQSTPPCSTQSSPPCSTQSTPPYSTQSTSLLHPSTPPRSPRPECSSGGNEAEAYVTMSSFYQIQ
ncbi:interleukin-7 receptor subunit alpha-like [Pseudoliparis swirei]|uniref:interleukin-7 receptor subunit alpha-like n=1 Tax=Pseudoliparis swirei TaxID=2059687 RepID=UPI0024BDCCB4|nr:interleukin-7 receptor subunit alpha-like [Pseudoliparis swirei]